MKATKTNKSKGFTIIETLIVLAIAATIFLVVFLAVSSLNRSSRNTQRKDDAAAVLAGVGNYVSNNDGSLPIAVAADGTTGMSLTGGVGSSTIPESVKLAHYYVRASAQTVSIDPAGTTVYSGSVASDKMIIVEQATCASSNATKPSTIAGVYAVIWSVESSSGFNWSCIGS